MSETIRYIASNPVLLGILAIAGLLVLLFILKKLFKFALILVLVTLIGFLLYYGFTTPGNVEEKMKGAYEKTKTKSEAVLKKGKEKVVEEGKKLTKKGIDKTGDRKKLFEKQQSFTDD